MRAIAVSAVVLFHAGIGEAGFVGVDIFFVISGYLITALLLEEHRSTGRIRLLNFYARRVRRIVPASILVILVTLSLSAALLPPSAQSQVARSGMSAALFGANFYFQSATGGYFDSSSEEMPLLHLWTLSVEEQFYLVWPALLLMLLKNRSYLVPVVAGLSIVSFAVSEMLIEMAHQAAFFQMPARMWEFGAGGLIAATRAQKPPKWAMWSGILLIAYACAVPQAHFPGAGALPAVAGATLVLVAVHGGVTNSVLASRPLVWAGLLSYSLYLWHWPLLALYESTIIGAGTTLARVSLCGVALLLAAATYRYLEQPIRSIRSPPLKTVITGATALGLVALGSNFVAGGFNSKPIVVETAATRASNDRAEDFILRCEYGLLEPIDEFPKRSCIPSADARVVLWGDSMAMAWQPMVAIMDGYAASYTRSGCPPVLGYLVEFRARVIANLCVEFNRKVVAEARGETLVLAARWGMYPDIEIALGKTLAEVSPNFRRIIVIGVTPEMRDSAARCLEHNQVEACTITRREFERIRDPIRARLLAVARPYPQVEYLEPTDFFCSATSCPLVKDGYSLYSDQHHVSATAARAFALQGR